MVAFDNKYIMMSLELFWKFTSEQTTGGIVRSPDFVNFEIWTTQNKKCLHCNKKYHLLAGSYYDALVDIWGASHGATMKSVLKYENILIAVGCKCPPSPFPSFIVMHLVPGEL